MSKIELRNAVTRPCPNGRIANAPVPKEGYKVQQRKNVTRGATALVLAPAVHVHRAIGSLVVVVILGL